MAFHRWIATHSHIAQSCCVFLQSFSLTCLFIADEENDMVAIGSDEELIQAMIYGRPNGLLKLYLRQAPTGPHRPNGGE